MYNYKSFRGQAGLEYLVLFGLVLSALLVIAYSFYSDFQVRSREFQAEVAVDRLASAANAVAAQGPGSSTKVLAYFPPGIANATAGGREVMVSVYSTSGRKVDFFRVTLANLTFSQLPIVENRYSFIVSFDNGNVSIALE